MPSAFVPALPLLRLLLRCPHPRLLLRVPRWPPARLQPPRLAFVFFVYQRRASYVFSSFARGFLSLLGRLFGLLWLFRGSFPPRSRYRGAPASSCLSPGVFLLLSASVLLRVGLLFALHVGSAREAVGRASTCCFCFS